MLWLLFLLLYNTYDCFKKLVSHKIVHNPIQNVYLYINTLNLLVKLSEKFALLVDPMKLLLNVKSKGYSQSKDLTIQLFAYTSGNISLNLIFLALKAR